MYEITYNTWKIGIYMAHMGDNEMRAVCTSAKKVAELFGTPTCDKSKLKALILVEASTISTRSQKLKLFQNKIQVSFSIYFFRKFMTISRVLNTDTEKLFSLTVSKPNINVCTS